LEGKSRERESEDRAAEQARETIFQFKERSLVSPEKKQSSHNKSRSRKGRMREKNRVRSKRVRGLREMITKAKRTVGEGKDRFEANRTKGSHLHSTSKTKAQEAAAYEPHSGARSSENPIRRTWGVWRAGAVARGRVGNGYPSKKRGAKTTKSYVSDHQLGYESERHTENHTCEKGHQHDDLARPQHWIT